METQIFDIESFIYAYWWLIDDRCTDDFYVLIQDELLFGIKRQVLYTKLDIKQIFYN